MKTRFGWLLIGLLLASVATAGVVKRYRGQVAFEDGGILLNGTAVTSTAAELNILDGVTSTAAELNILDGVTATAAELNLNDAQTATAAEVNELDLSAVGAGIKIKKLSISSTPTGSEQDTTWDLPAKAAVLKVWVDVTTAEATGGTKTLDIGTDGSGSNDPDGFIDGLDVSSTGVKTGRVVATAGSNNGYVGASATHTHGILMFDRLVAGEDVANGGDGVAVLGADVTSGAESITYTAGSADWAEFRGAIYIMYIELGT